MRIISGIYKSRRFALPKNLDARPTTDFAKENIFNVIHNLMELEGAVALDLFAGTGSIGFELLSRGCREVVCIEKNRIHYNFICKVAQELRAKNLKPLNGDVFKYLENSRQTFDFIFADPPYALPDLKRIPEIVLSGNRLNEGGIFIMEHSGEYDFSHLPGFRQHRVYGSVNFSIFLHQRSEQAH
jgi:16S rRNA (guanine(966)-N(2))-methyltransferase RsmD